MQSLIVVLNLDNFVCTTHINNYNENVDKLSEIISV